MKLIKKILFYSILFVFIVLVGIPVLYAFNIFTNDSERLNDEPAYVNTRVEGQSKWYVYSSAVNYVRKYRNKRLDATSETKEYFTFQRDLYREFKKQAVPDSALNLAFVGDIMWVRENWNDFLDPGIKQHFEKQHMVFGNLESPIDTVGDVPGLFGDYLFYNSAAGLVKSFYSEAKECNYFTALSLANNHCLDMDAEGMFRTIHFLDKQNIKHHGVSHENKQKKYVQIEEQGIRIGFYAATYGINSPERLPGAGLKVNVIPGIAPINSSKVDLSEIKSALEAMRNDSIDFKILSLHWGNEYEIYPDPEIVKVAHKMVEAGADLIIGSHPHVFQPNEICFVNDYQDDILINTDARLLQRSRLNDNDGRPRKAMVMYSLGNFVTAMYTPLCRVGVIQSLKLYRNPESGHVDWTTPDMEFVYNTDADPITKSRKLMMWEHYIQAKQEVDIKTAKEEKEKVEFIIHHIGGDK